MTETLSLRQKVFNYLDKNPTADRMKTIEAFSEYSANSVRTYFTQYYKILKENISQNISQQRSGPIKDKNTTLLQASNGNPDHLSLALVERIIREQLQTDRSSQMIKNALDFLKLKNNEGEEVDEVDLSKFLKVFETGYTKTSID